MFKVNKIIIIAQDEKKYLSFPDIIRSKKNLNIFFIVYREGNNHHPVWSNLVLMRSKNKGRTWERFKEFRSTLRYNSAVWNCPRLSYIDDKELIIICDKKNGTKEKKAIFSTFFIKLKDRKWGASPEETPLPGVVPDKIIKFKNKLFCANHKIKSIKNDLIQLISWSKDGGKVWYDTNIMANDPDKQFCEASVVNVDNKYLIAYLRDNSGHQRNIHTVKSYDGIYWEDPVELPIFGQRVTAIKEGNINIGTFRNTKNCTVSIFEHNLESGKIDVCDIDTENFDNLYHFGYTGITKISDNLFFVVYYIKQEEENPFIKLAIVERI